MIRTLLTTLLQKFCKIILNLKVIVKMPGDLLNKCCLDLS